MSKIYCSELLKFKDYYVTEVLKDEGFDDTKYMLWLNAFKEEYDVRARNAILRQFEYMHKKRHIMLTASDVCDELLADAEADESSEPDPKKKKLDQASLLKEDGSELEAYEIKSYPSSISDGNAEISDQYFTFVCSPAIGEICEMFFTKNGYDYLAVKHSDTGEDHWHFIVCTPKGVDSSANCEIPVVEELSRRIYEQFTDTLRKGIKRIAMKEGIRFVPGKNFRGARHTSIFRWMEYVKHEYNDSAHMTLEGTKRLVDAFGPFFYNISKRTAMVAKDTQISRKLMHAKKAREEASKYVRDKITDVIYKYDIYTMEQYIRIVPEPVQEKLDWIHSFNDELTKLLRRRNATRQKWETKSIEHHGVFETGVINTLRSEMIKCEKASFETGQTEFLLAGIELLWEILFANNITAKELLRAVKDVMQGELDKKKSIIFVGPSNTGKSTITKLMVKPFYKCTIGQTGNASQFVFQEIPGKTVVLVEEMSITKELVNDWKMLCEGTVFEVQTKHKAPVATETAPPIVASANRLPWFPHCSGEAETFRNRMHVYEIHNFAPLKNVTDKYRGKFKCTEKKIYLNYLHLYALDMYLDMTEDWAYEPMDTYKFFRSMMIVYANLTELPLKSNAEWVGICAAEFKEVVDDWDTYEDAEGIPEPTEEQANLCVRLCAIREADRLKLV